MAHQKVITHIKKDNSWCDRHSQFLILTAFFRRHCGSLTWNRRSQIDDEWGFFCLFFTHDLLRSLRKNFVFYISFHVVYMFFINIQPDHNMAFTWILTKVTKEIKSRSTKRHISVLYFCLVLIDQNKQCTENQIRCLTSVYKGIMQNYTVLPKWK